MKIEIAKKEEITVEQLYTKLKDMIEKNPECAKKKLFIEASHMEFKKESGWETYQNSEGWIFVKPAWEYGVNIEEGKDTVALCINY